MLINAYEFLKVSFGFGFDLNSFKDITQNNGTQFFFDFSIVYSRTKLIADLDRLDKIMYKSIILMTLTLLMTSQF